MADNKQHDKDNLIDLASERRKYQNRPTPLGPKSKVGTQNSSKKAPIKTAPRWYNYLQLVAFLAFLAWAMQQCQAT